MTFEEAHAIILDLLRAKGKAKNSEMLKAIGNDAALLESVREDLIFNDLASDKNNVGLIYQPEYDQEARQSPAAAESRGVRADFEESASLASSGIEKPTIFISYGRKDAEDLAKKLEQDLARDGYDVWRDKTKIRSGASWEEQIEHALLERKVFIALLSPHAVRRPDGVCLDEISMARYHGRTIIPAMVVQCRPPLGVFRLDWLDFQNWNNEGNYQKTYGRLTDTLVEGTEVEGYHAHIFSRLRPLDFSVELSRLNRYFTGREWLFDELDQWLEDENSRVFFITGDPGVGKSAVMARIADKNERVGAFHFCIFSLLDSCNPFRFARSIASQLATQFPDYRAALEAANLERLDETDPGSLLRRLVIDPLKAVKLEGPVLILVDGLDESRAYGGRDTIAKVLCERLSDFPNWVRLVISSRKEPDILDSFSSYKPREIDTGCEGNRGDIRKYLKEKASKTSLKELLSGERIDLENFITITMERSEGNFLFVAEALKAVESGLLDPANPEDFPVGLVGLYQSFFERMFPGRQGYRDFQPILSVLCAAREPLTLTQIANILNMRPFDVEERLSRFAVYFPFKDDVYQAFHKSIIDWLTVKAGQDFTYRVDVQQGHERISRNLLDAYSSDSRDRFMLAHLPAHLIGAKDWASLETVLTDLRFIEAKCAAGMIHDLIIDYNSAIDALPEAQEENKKKREAEERVVRYSREIIAYARTWSEARGSHKHDPQKCPLPQPGDIPLPEVVPVVERWSDEKIRQESDRMTCNPTRLDRLRLFKRFVNAQSHHVVKYPQLPGFIIQQAYNSADSGPVAGAAEGSITQERDAVLMLRKVVTRPVFNPFPGLLFTLSGHSDLVWAVAVTADGGARFRDRRIILSGCGTWSTETS